MSPGIQVLSSGSTAVSTGENCAFYSDTADLSSENDCVVVTVSTLSNAANSIAGNSGQTNPITNTIVGATGCGVSLISEAPVSSPSSTPYRNYLDLFEEEYDSDGPGLQEAISRSLNTGTSESDTRISLQGILETIASRVNNGDIVCFNIIRKNVWDGASRAMCRSNFSPEKKMDVKFTDDYGISEGAVDNGGPTREFFRLCLYEIKDKIGIFEGPPNAKVLTCNYKGGSSSFHLHFLMFFFLLKVTQLGSLK
ncbi:uncharacterized protein LOC117506117 [Thalassophryne amazonica]|uniref:uncharacterized protein LOC117506117 n=1 Tax=Thalassophryne amazonica TaxID=390379 RepID=UPI00147089FA|nr:uncharacterized protein LOC117506117 [Thalassophryne amazonica]